jgi:hypothetical protein
VIVGVITSIGWGQVRNAIHTQHRDEIEESIQQHGGRLKALFSLAHLRKMALIDAPFAPRWMWWFSIIVPPVIAVMLMGIAIYGVIFTEPFQFRAFSVFPMLSLLWGSQSLAILYSKWRELSQPAATASPEVRPS